MEQAVWALGNIAGDNANFRNIVTNAGIIEPLIQVINKSATDSTITRNAAWTLSNLCRGKPVPDFSIIQKGLPSLSKVMKDNSNEDILTDVCWALSYISDGGEERIPYIIETNILPRLVELLDHHNVAIAIPCLRTIGNIVTGDDKQTQAVINAGALANLDRLLDHPKKPVRKEVCWALSNITAGTPEQIHKILDYGIMDKLINILIKDDNEIKKEAIWAVSNSTSSGDAPIIFKIVEKGAIKVLVQMLSAMDARTLAVSLEGLENILNEQEKAATPQNPTPFSDMIENEGGLDKIEGLQTHPNQTIYNKV